jgi:hypothetical protein
MKHRRTGRFAKAFTGLPPGVKEQARKAFLRFQDNMSHPGLSIERIEGHPGVWSGRVSHRYRWTFHFEEDEETGERICVHRVIGAHDQVYRDP